ncbi:hypothetical protein C7431_11151 [Pantoea allii]|uniref:Uncharacterized protein n=1 Tax=Pantoea allii TaxID=574096 RepID=A0A2V2BC10_9GAMM|nr:hypothetical protein C7431_11151 [Pantoea allii]
MFCISFYKARGGHEIINDPLQEYFNFGSALSVGFWLKSEALQCIPVYPEQYRWQYEARCQASLFLMCA